MSVLYYSLAAYVLVGMAMSWWIISITERRTDEEMKPSQTPVPLFILIVVTIVLIWPHAFYRIFLRGHKA